MPMRVCAAPGPGIPIRVTAQNAGNGPGSERWETARGRARLAESMALTEAATPTAIAALRHRVAEFATAHGAGARLAGDVALAVSEAATNAVKYAYPGAARKGAVELAAQAGDGWLEVRVRDRGAGFGRGSSDGLGLGLSIMASLSAELTIVQEGEGTEVRMRFPLPRARLA
jgi:anti-sigma regulatory factor (Ser/Thr protein kinase)